MSKLKSIEESDPTSTEEKLLAAFDKQRARSFMNNIITMIRAAVKQEKKLDTSSNAQNKSFIISVHGASVEDRNAKHLIN